MIAERISRRADVMAQVHNHSAQQVMHGLFPERVLDTVQEAMNDHEKAVAGSAGYRNQKAERLRW